MVRTSLLIVSVVWVGDIPSPLPDLEDAVPSDRVFQTNGDHVVFSALNSEGNMIPPERQNTEEEGVFISASALRYASGKTSHRLRHLLQDGAPTGDSNFDQHSALKCVPCCLCVGVCLGRGIVGVENPQTPSL